MASELFLNLNKVTLIGYEYVTDQCIDSIIKGIENDDVFPPAKVLRLDDGSYLLVPPDGGHNRAVGHYIMNKPLRVIVVELDEIIPEYIYKNKNYNYFKDRFLKGYLGKVVPVGELLIEDDGGEFFRIKSSCSFYRK